MKSGKGLGISVLVVAIVMACVKLKSDKPYGYYDELQRYLFTHHHLDISLMDGTLLIIPVGGCAPCVGESLNLAVRQSSTNLRVVLLADSRKSYLPYQEVINKLPPDKLHLETQGNDNDYELGIFSPVLLRLEAGRITAYNELSTQNINEVEKNFFNN